MGNFIFCVAKFFNQVITNFSRKQVTISISNFKKGSDSVVAS